MRQDYPLNLSISFSGGNESNSDTLSSGEWRGLRSSRRRVGNQPNVRLMSINSLWLLRQCVEICLEWQCQGRWEPCSTHAVEEAL